MIFLFLENFQREFYEINSLQVKEFFYKEIVPSLSVSNFGINNEVLEKVLHMSKLHPPRKRRSDCLLFVPGSGSSASPEIAQLSTLPISTPSKRSSSRISSRNVSFKSEKSIDLSDVADESSDTELLADPLQISKADYSLNIPDSDYEDISQEEVKSPQRTESSPETLVALLHSPERDGIEEAEFRGEINESCTSTQVFPSLQTPPENLRIPQYSPVKTCKKPELKEADSSFAEDNSTVKNFYEIEISSSEEVEVCDENSYDLDLASSELDSDDSLIIEYKCKTKKHQSQHKTTIIPFEEAMKIILSQRKSQ